MISSSIKTPEWIWRQDMWRKATGGRKVQIAAWNKAWSRSGDRSHFPDLDDFIIDLSADTAKR